MFYEPDQGVFPKRTEVDLKDLNQVIQLMAEAGGAGGALAKGRSNFIGILYGRWLRKSDVDRKSGRGWLRLK